MKILNEQNGQIMKVKIEGKWLTPEEIKKLEEIKTASGVTLNGSL